MSFLNSVQKLFAPRKRTIGATDIRRALTHNEFVFYYQPEWDLKTGAIRGLEALVRWESPHGIIPPNEFIPVLEETGLINEFTPFMFDQTLQDLREIHAMGFTDLFLSVNLSMTQLSDASLLNTITQALEKHSIDPNHLECEITETNEMKKKDLVLQNIKALREKGIKLSIDDFGSGHASFNYVKNLETEKIKIDIDFVQSLFEKPVNQTIMRTIIELGHSLNLSVLAEGIETPEQAAWLKENGCDFGQGFLFSRPLPLAMMLSFLRTQADKNQAPSEQ